MKFAMIALSAVVLSGSGYAVWHLKATADFERGRQQFLADTANIAPPAAQQEQERYLFIDNALAKSANR